jgi:hypothetical protein
MSETSQSFRHEAEKIFTSTSEFHFPGMDQVLESANQNGQETVQSDACFELLPKDEMSTQAQIHLPEWQSVYDSLRLFPSDGI